MPTFFFLLSFIPCPRCSLSFPACSHCLSDGAIMRVPASSTNGGVACLLTTFTKRYRRKPIRLPHHGTSVGNAKRRGARHCSLRQKRYVPPRSALAPFSREARRFPSASSSSPFFPSFQPLGDDHWRAKRGFKDPASAARAAGTVFFFFSLELLRHIPSGFGAGSVSLHGFDFR